MLNQTRLVWIGLILAISLGLAIEALKSTRASQDGSSWRPRIFGMALEDGDESEGLEHRNVKANRARSRLLKGRVAGLSDTSAFVQPPVVAAVVAGPPVPNLTPLGGNMTADAKKKAAEEAKKKKKKKKKKASAEEVAASPVEPATDVETPKSSDSVEVTGSSSMNRPTNDRRLHFVGNDLNENPETLEEWLAYILREPNYDRTLKLIKGHEMHTVDSEIFHEVITQMLADARDKMHEYAILALGSSPSLKSFILLESANAAEPQGSPLKLMSRTSLKDYAKLENLRYLASAISGGAEAGAALEAMRLIQIAVADYKPQAAPPTKGPSTLAATISRQFTSLIPVLVRASNMSDDASLRREAEATLRHVQTIVRTPTPVAVN